MSSTLTLQIYTYAPQNQKTILTVKLGLLLKIWELSENSTEKTRTLRACSKTDGKKVENDFAHDPYSSEIVIMKTSIKLLPQ